MHMHKALLLLRKVPKGKVTTYRILAKACGTSPRAIGRIMANNIFPEKYPCYKVVLSSGKIGGYSAGGTERKAVLLRKEGIKIKNGKIDMNKHLHRFPCHFWSR